MLIKFLIYGSMGWIMEILWTGLNSLLKKDYKMMGTTSIWMFFIYGLAVFMAPVCDILIRFPVLVRGGCYVLCIFVIEYITGTLLKRIHVCPWDYSASRFSVHGLIRLDFAPVWFAAGLIFEKAHLLLRLIYTS
ncbi:MAG: putative ABC transporter permease [Clostridiales bacterium]|jgi:uncharacterized membrane protein|nr:putative ABC transporter permease [Clostridiales bacterium]